MKTFINCAAQGDLLIRRIAELPKGLTPMQVDRGAFIVAHSETGHHHVIKEKANVQVYTSDDPLVSYLEVIAATEEVETLIEHLRSYDTHESLRVSPGVYELRRQREYTPEGWRRVED